jgi:DNA uptake protein ComE-like DNA-binding protein
MNSTRREEGFILVAVLWMLAIMIILAFGVSRHALVERRMSWYSLDKEQATQMARGGVERALVELRNKSVLDEISKKSGMTTPNQRWAEAIDLLDEKDFFQEPNAKDFKKDVVLITIEDCERKISINHASREWLQQLYRFSPTMLEEIVERREPKDRLNPQFFSSLEEFRDSSDIKDNQWYGSARNAGLSDVLTIWGDPDGKVNINTASPEVLMAIPGVNKQIIAAFLNFRNGEDGEPGTRDDQFVSDINKLSARLEISADKLSPLKEHCKTDSQFFTIHVRATRRQGKINAFCQVTVELSNGETTIKEWREDVIGS